MRTRLNAPVPITDQMRQEFRDRAMTPPTAEERKQLAAEYRATMKKPLTADQSESLKNLRATR